jgi:hypothetical protein
MFHLLIIAFIFLFVSGCGYKGDPKYTAAVFENNAKQDLSDDLISPQREIS